MKKNFSKQQAKEKIKDFFLKIDNRSPKEIKKIKRLAMKYNLPLKENKKLFCKKCSSPYKFPKIRIKNGMKNMLCEKCGKISRWRIK